MSIISEFLVKEQKTAGIEFTTHMLEQFETYARLLAEWNEKMNLTAIIKPEEIAAKHFLDSLMIMKYQMFKAGDRLADIGTGAGFPGIPLLIVCPELKLTLIDSLNKRLIFLEHVLKTLGLQAELVHARGEEAGRKKEYRQKFDFTTARAVSHLRELSEYTLPLLKNGGKLISMKGPQPAQEIEEAKKAIHLLGGELQTVETYFVPNAGERSLIFVKKISQTPPIYPRPSAKIAKFPLK